MAKHTAASGLMAKLGSKLKTAHAEHKDDATNYGQGGDLPAGVTGVARLVDCRFGIYKTGNNKGEYFFIASGVVVLPASLNGLPVAGLRTQVMEPLCETPARTRKTIADHAAKVLNHFRLLGVDTKGIRAEDYETVAEALKKAKPHFRFRTWSGAKQTTGPYAGQEPLVNHDWGEVCPAPEMDESAPTDAVIDETVDVDTEATDKVNLEALAQAADAQDEAAAEQIQEIALKAGISQEEVDATPSWEAVVERLQATPDEEDEDEEDEDEEDEEDEDEEEEDGLALLGEKADGDDEEAQASLTDLAKEAELDPDEYSTWAELATALESQPDTDEEEEEEAEEEEEEEEEEEAATPEKGDVWRYKPPKKRKLVDVEITAVFDGKKTCNVKALDDQKVYKSVPWAELVDVD